MKIRHVKKYFHGIQYHPEMKGSASLKSVLPAFVPNLSYADLATADGETTSLMYLKTLKNELPEEEKKRIYANLVEYCHLDNLAEMKLLEVLYGALPKVVAWAFVVTVPMSSFILKRYGFPGCLIPMWLK